MGPIIEQVSEGILEIYFPEPLTGIDLVQLKKELYEENERDYGRKCPPVNTGIHCPLRIMSS